MLADVNRAVTVIGLAVVAGIALGLVVSYLMVKAVRAVQRKQAGRRVLRGWMTGRERFEPYPYSLEDLPPVLEPYAEQIRALAVPAVSLRAERAGHPLPVEASKFAGVPCLPEATPWPENPKGEPLAFMGQLNFAEILAAIDVAGGLVPPDLPKAGVLCFFYDLEAEPAGYDRRDQEYWRFCWVADPSEVTGARVVPQQSKFAPLESRLIPAPCWSLPSLEDEATSVPAMPEEANEEYHELTVLSTPPPAHFVLGYSMPVQGDPRGDVPAVRRGEEKVADWRLLWQIDTDDSSLTMYGDCGIMYVLIPAADLKAGRFDRLWLVAQCA
jgi:uncharacterized protein YwqG